MRQRFWFAFIKNGARCDWMEWKGSRMRDRGSEREWKKVVLKCTRVNQATTDNDSSHSGPYRGLSWCQHVEVWKTSYNVPHWIHHYSNFDVTLQTWCWNKADVLHWPSCIFGHGGITLKKFSSWFSNCWYHCVFFDGSGLPSHERHINRLFYISCCYQFQNGTCSQKVISWFVYF